MKVLVNRPIISQIEITNFCNLSCPMCPRTNHMNRDIEFMTLNFFNNIIFNLNLINRGNSGVPIQLHQFGESTFHPQLKEILEICSKNNLRTFISTNGTNLTEKVRKRIIGNLDEMWISFDSLNKKMYEKMRKNANYEKTIDNVTKLINEKGNKKPKVYMSTLIHVDKKEYEKFWRDRGIKHFIFKNYHNWRGEEDIKEFTNIKDLSYSNDPCLYLLTSLCILVNGDVVPCCMDYNGDMVLGNLVKQSLEEIWYGEKYRNLRLKHYYFKEKNDLDFCKYCTNYPKKSLTPKDVDS